MRGSCEVRGGEARHCLPGSELLLCTGGCAMGSLNSFFPIYGRKQRRRTTYLRLWRGVENLQAQECRLIVNRRSHERGTDNIEPKENAGIEFVCDKHSAIEPAVQTTPRASLALSGSATGDTSSTESSRSPLPTCARWNDAPSSCLTDHESLERT